VSNSHAALAALLAPFSVEEFLAEVWGKRTLVVKGARGKFAALYSEAQWRANRAGEATGTYVDASLPGGHGVQELRPEEVVGKYEQGMLTTNFRLEEHNPAIAELMNALHASFGLPMPVMRDRYNGANCFASKDGAGIKPHFDATHIFILQVVGAKRWQVQREPGLVEPLVVSGQMEIDAPDLEQELSVQLEEGDLLYMAPGTWHTTAAVGPSISLSLDLAQRTVLSLFLDVIRGVLANQPKWRAWFPRTGSGAEVPELVKELVRERQEALAGAIRGLDPRLFELAWARDAARTYGPRPTASGRMVEAETRLRRPSPVPMRFAVGPTETAGEDAVYVFFGQRDETRISLPVDGLRLIAEIARRERFVAKDALEWADGYDWDTVGALLAGLVDQGALVIDD
jgi:ribosomal protein L16 Arg81 hydroxylase